jgi:hypothetical protein
LNTDDKQISFVHSDGLECCPRAGYVLAGDTIVMRDGTSLEGELLSGDARTLVASVGGVTRSVTVFDVESIRFGPATGAPSASPGQTIPANTALTIRRIDAIDSQTGSEGKEYRASLDQHYRGHTECAGARFL